MNQHTAKQLPLNLPQLTEGFPDAIKQSYLQQLSSNSLDIRAIEHFMIAADQPFNFDTLQKYYRTITQEELNEREVAFRLLQANYDSKTFRIAYADAIIDSVWCLLAELMCITESSNSIVQAYNEVAISNLSKISQSSGKIEKNAAGKVLKPFGYYAPNLSHCILTEAEKSARRAMDAANQGWC